MDNFLKIVNDLQDVFSTVGVSPEIISLPQIVVVGSQSTGKTSVLEGIVRKNFLPRGSGIVTRRPLIIQISQDPSAKTPYGVFLHEPGTVYTDFDDICREIIQDTNNVCGTDKGIKEDPITLKIHSHDLPTLTLVDLPGMTKNPVGSQPKDIEQQTTALVKKYIENPNCIIPAVSPGNIDIANSEAIKLAKEVDPEGKRTLAVITKVDLMEKTSENNHVLEGKVIPIKLGIVGVINRTQAQIDADITMEECLGLEAEYFKNNYNYMSNEMGTPYLTQRLCTILMHHVKECLPDLIIRITEQKVIQQNILDSLGDRVEDASGMLTELVMTFCQEFKRNIEGRRAVVIGGNRAMSGGRLLFEVFEKAICDELDKISLPDDIEAAIKHEIVSAGGHKPALFTPNSVFDNLAAEQIENFFFPIKKSIKKCSESITEIISTLSKKMFERFPNLKRETHQIALGMLLSKTQHVEKFVDCYFKCELCYINTNHRLFIKNRPIIEQSSYTNDGETKDELTPEEQNIKKIKGLLDLYIHIIRNQLMDVVPKTVVCYMVMQFCDDLHKDLMKNLFATDRIDELMKENLLVEERREKALKMLAALERAEAITSMLE